MQSSQGGQHSSFLGGSCDHNQFCTYSVQQINPLQMMLHSATSYLSVAAGISSSACWPSPERFPCKATQPHTQKHPVLMCLHFHSQSCRTSHSDDLLPATLPCRSTSLIAHQYTSSPPSLYPALSASTQVFLSLVGVGFYRCNCAPSMLPGLLPPHPLLHSSPCPLLSCDLPTPHRIHHICAAVWQLQSHQLPLPQQLHPIPHDPWNIINVYIFDLSMMQHTFDYNKKYIYAGKDQWCEENNLQNVEWAVVKLCVVNCERMEILKDIEHVHLGRLKMMFLYGNAITSIEHIANISMPNLQILSLSNNNICWVRGLRKGKWVWLSELQIGTSSSMQPTTLSSGGFQFVKTIFIDDLTTPSSHFEDIRPMVKMHPCPYFDRYYFPITQPFTSQEYMSLKWRISSPTNGGMRMYLKDDIIIE